MLQLFNLLLTFIFLLPFFSHSSDADTLLTHEMSWFLPPLLSFIFCTFLASLAWVLWQKSPTLILELSYEKGCLLFHQFVSDPWSGFIELFHKSCWRIDEIWHECSSFGPTLFFWVLFEVVLYFYFISTFTQLLFSPSWEVLNLE